MEQSRVAFLALIILKNFLILHKLFLSKNFKTSKCKENPFPRLKVKLKDEIVSLGNKLANPGEIVGDYVKPEDWNKLISQDDVLVLDTRNKYEVSIGTFQNAIQPQTTNFREFSDWIEDSSIGKNKKVAMFCTGGIRCEKSILFNESKRVY